jgi:hypothetical protein
VTPGHSGRPQRRRDLVGLLEERVTASGEIDQISWNGDALPMYETVPTDGPVVVLARPARLELTTFRSAT